jgi:hypothetical protein
MLPPGLETCPACGARLGKSGGIAQIGANLPDPARQYTTKDIFWISAYMIALALVPLAIIILIGLICVWVGN